MVPFRTRQVPKPRAQRTAQAQLLRPALPQLSPFTPALHPGAAQGGHLPCGEHFLEGQLQIRALAPLLTSLPQVPHSQLEGAKRKEPAVSGAGG